MYQTLLSLHLIHLLVVLGIRFLVSHKHHIYVTSLKMIPQKYVSNLP